MASSLDSCLPLFNNQLVPFSFPRVLYAHEGWVSVEVAYRRSGDQSLPWILFALMEKGMAEEEESVA